MLGHIKRWYLAHERYLLPASLLAGLISDLVMFQHLNTSLVFSVLAAHLALSAATIAFMQWYDGEGRHTKNHKIAYLRVFSPLLLQYSLGALLSAFFIFYWFSGSFFASWPFLLAVSALMIGNDFLRTYYARAPVIIGVYFFVLYSYCALVLPYVLAEIAPWVFIMAGVIALGGMLLFLGALSLVAPHAMRRRIMLGNIILSVFGGMMVLYFTNLIPPVPLSIRDIGVYHLVEREGGDYRVLGEGRSWLYERVIGKTFHRVGGSPIYVYSAVFAPTSFSTTVVHHWYFRNERGTWVSADRIAFPLQGGRDDGYRGFSRKASVFPGAWRVDVETPRGQVIGRITFHIVDVPHPPPLFVELK